MNALQPQYGQKCRLCSKLESFQNYADAKKGKIMANWNSRIYFVYKLLILQRDEFSFFFVELKVTANAESQGKVRVGWDREWAVFMLSLFLFFYFPLAIKLQYNL